MSKKITTLAIFFLLFIHSGISAFQFEDYEWGRPMCEVKAMLVVDKRKNLIPACEPHALAYLARILNKPCKAKLFFTPQSKLLAGVEVLWDGASVRSELKNSLTKQYGQAQQAAESTESYNWKGSSQYDVLTLSYASSQTRLFYHGGTYWKKRQEELASLAPLGKRWALLIQTVAPGTTKSVYRQLIKRYHYPKNQVIVLGKTIDKTIRDDLPSKENINRYLDQLIKKVGKDDFLFILGCSHTHYGYLIEKTFSFKELDAKLKQIQGARIVVVAESCYSGVALKHLTRPDIIYTSANDRESCWGAFMELFPDVLGNNKKAFRTADTNRDRRVSLGEAFDYISDPGRLKKWHDAYRKMVPSTPDAHPQRNKNSVEYTTWLD